MSVGWNMGVKLEYVYTFYTTERVECEEMGKLLCSNFTLPISWWVKVDEVWGGRLEDNKKAL